MPRQIKVSFKVGVYSTISPRGVGTNPGMTSPMPFSIQMPTMQRTQVRFNHFKLRLSGKTNRNMAMRLKAMAVQIHGTRAWYPCKPRNKYFDEATWRLPE